MGVNTNVWKAPGPVYHVHITKQSGLTYSIIDFCFSAQYYMRVSPVEWALSPRKILVVALTGCSTSAVVSTSCMALPRYRI